MRDSEDIVVDKSDEKGVYSVMLTDLLYLDPSVSIQKKSSDKLVELVKEVKIRLDNEDINNRILLFGDKVVDIAKYDIDDFKTLPFWGCKIVIL